MIIWDVESKQMVFKPLVKHKGGVESVCFSPDGKRLASGSLYSKVIIWDTETGATQIGQPCTGHTDKIYSLAISSDGSFIVTASHDKTVRLW
ncbi:WD40-repeat-containing domain protein, partial [Suillus americanus]